MEITVLLLAYLIMGTVEAFNFKREYPNGRPLEVFLTVVTMPAIKMCVLVKMVVQYVYKSILAIV